jgi:hypothetical protein
VSGLRSRSSAAPGSPHFLNPVPQIDKILHERVSSEGALNVDVPAVKVIDTTSQSLQHEGHSTDIKGRDRAAPTAHDSGRSPKQCHNVDPTRHVTVTAHRISLLSSTFRYFHG